MIRILGLDPSINAAGIAVMDIAEPGAKPHVWAATVGDSNTSRAIEARFRHVLSYVWQAARTDVPCLAVIEEPLVPKSKTTSDTILKLGGLHYLIRYGLAARGIPFIVLGNTVIKQYATGAGNAGKPVVTEAANYHLRHLTHAGDDNQADALWCLAIAAHHYLGVPLHHSTASAAWISTVMARLNEWPQWSIPDRYRSQAERQTQ